MAVLLPGRPGPRGRTGATWSTGVDAITEVPPARWDAALLRPGRAGAGRPALLPARRVRRRATPTWTPRGSGSCRTPWPGTEPDQLIALSVAAPAIADAGGDDRLPAARPDRRGPRPRRLPHARAGAARPAGAHRRASWCARCGELLPDLDDGRARAGAGGLHRAARAGAAGVGDRPGAQPRRVPRGQPARPARPGVHGRRRLRVLADRRRPRGARAEQRAAATWCWPAACTTATTSRFWSVFTPARGAVASRADPAVPPRRRRHPDRRGHRRSSCSSGWPTPSATATGSTR